MDFETLKKKYRVCEQANYFQAPATQVRFCPADVNLEKMKLTFSS